MTAFLKKHVNDGEDVYRIDFEDGSTVGVIFEHLFFDITEGKFIAINSDSQEFVGHEFAKVKDGKIVPVKVSKIYKDGKVTETFGPQAEGHLNFLTGGFITGNGGQIGLCNMFDFDTESMTFNAAKKAEDLEKYGSLNYQEFKDIVSQEFFDANSFSLFSVAFGKGLAKEEAFKAYLNRLAGCFFNNNIKGSGD